MRNIVSVDLYHVNCTDTDYVECHIAFWIWHTIPLILFSIGIFGNILNCVVLSRPRLRKNSTSVYLLFLAGSDLCFLVFGLLPDTVHGIADYKFQDNSPFFCRIRYWFIYTFGAFSVWLLVLLTVERFLLTKAPIKTKSRLTPKTSFVVSLTTLVILLLANVYNITGFKYYSSKYEIIEEFGSDLLSYPCTYSSKEYRDFHNGILGIIILVVFNILPIIIIVVGNINIACVIICRKRKRNAVNPSSIIIEKLSMNSHNEHVRPNADTQVSFCAVSNGQNGHVVNEHIGNSVCHMGAAKSLNINESQCSKQQGKARNILLAQRTKPRNNIRKRNYNSPTRMLFTLTIFFIVATTPYCIYLILVRQLQTLSEREVAKWQLINVCVLVLGWCNYAFNFFLYFVSGTLFKREWTRLIQVGKVRFQNLFR